MKLSLGELLTEFKRALEEERGVLHERIMAFPSDERVADYLRGQYAAFDNSYHILKRLIDEARKEL